MTKLLLKIADLEIKSVFIINFAVYLAWAGLRSRVRRVKYALCCQSNQALEKTEVGPYH